MSPQLIEALAYIPVVVIFVGWGLWMCYTARMATVMHEEMIKAEFEMMETVAKGTSEVLTAVIEKLEARP